MHDVAVIGAGAAGLTASIFAAEAAAQGDRPQNIVLLDGAKTIGAKILVSGGGRCNITHDVVTPTDFFGNRHIIKNVLVAFPVQATIVLFASLGVDLKREETGKLFPVTDKARTILTALVDRCRALGVIIHPYPSRDGRRSSSWSPSRVLSSSYSRNDACQEGHSGDRGPVNPQIGE